MKCPTCQSDEVIDGGEACAGCGCDLPPSPASPGSARRVFVVGSRSITSAALAAAVAEACEDGEIVIVEEPSLPVKPKWELMARAIEYHKEAEIPFIPPKQQDYPKIPPRKL